MTERIRTTLSLLSIVLLLAATGCQRQAENASIGALYTGYVEAELVYVSAPSSGWIISSAVREGDVVAADDLLFELEAELQDARLEEATDRLRQSRAQARDLQTGARPAEVEALEAQLDEGRTALELSQIERRRITDLVTKGILPQQQADQAIAENEKAQARVATLEANIEVARLAGRTAAREAAAATADAAAAAVRQAQWSLNERRVEARVGGRVEEIFQRPGEFVTAGAPVLALLPESSLEVRFFVPQEDLSRVQPGRTVEVSVGGSAIERAEPLEARITYVARQAEFTPPVIYSAESRDKLVFLVRAKFDDASVLRPGQPVDVRLP